MPRKKDDQELDALADGRLDDDGGQSTQEKVEQAQAEGRPAAEPFDPAPLEEQQDGLTADDLDLSDAAGITDDSQDAESDPDFQVSDARAESPPAALVTPTGEKVPYLFEGHGVVPSDKDAEREAWFANAPHDLEGHTTKEALEEYERQQKNRVIE